jgi:hypothetical protein
MASSQFTSDERFDGLYLNVAQTTRGIEPLLDTVFSFLRRKTDFFKGPPGTPPEEGSAAAVAKVNEVLRKHVELYEAERARKQAKEEDKKRAKTKEEEEEMKSKKEAVKKGTAKETEEEDHVIEMSEDGFDVSSAAAASCPPEKVASSAKEEGTTHAAEPGNVEGAETETETETTKMAAAPKEDNTNDDEADASVPPPVGNGGTVDGKYVWTQTLQEVTVNVPLHQPTRGRDLTVVMSKKHLKVGLKADVAAGGGYVIDAPLTKPIICDDSFWTVEDGTRLVINLQKLNQMEWWEGVCDGDATIDITNIQPENSKLDDLDGETRQTVEKMMFDNRQKAMGLPTSDEQKKFDMLEKFKKQHPEMDFSNAKMS